MLWEVILIQCANLELRIEARRLSVPLWQLADSLGISEATLYRQLRRDLPDEKKKIFLQTIRSLAGGEFND